MINGDEFWNLRAHEFSANEIDNIIEVMLSKKLGKPQIDSVKFMIPWNTNPVDTKGALLWCLDQASYQFIYSKQFSNFDTILRSHLDYSMREGSRDELMHHLSSIYQLFSGRPAGVSRDLHSNYGGPFIRFLERTFCPIAGASNSGVALAKAFSRYRARCGKSSAAFIRPVTADLLFATPEVLTQRASDTQLPALKEAIESLCKKAALKLIMCDRSADG